MNVVEQQLLSALRETPIETDCSVSFGVLETLGYTTRHQQEQWLNRHRSPRDGKLWHATEEHWEYCCQPQAIERDPPPALRILLPAAGAPHSIVVKPLTPLKKRQT